MFFFWLPKRYRVTAKGISAEGEIMIRIYPPAYWDLLQIRRNKTLYVEESTSVMISRDILEVRMNDFVHILYSNHFDCFIVFFEHNNGIFSRVKMRST